MGEPPSYYEAKCSKSTTSKVSVVATFFTGACPGCSGTFSTTAPKLLATDDSPYPIALIAATRALIESPESSR